MSVFPASSPTILIFYYHYLSCFMSHLFTSPSHIWPILRLPHNIFQWICTYLAYLKGEKNQCDYPPSLPPSTTPVIFTPFLPSYFQDCVSVIFQKATLAPTHSAPPITFLLSQEVWEISRVTLHNFPHIPVKCSRLQAGVPRISQGGMVLQWYTINDIFM